MKKSSLRNIALIWAAVMIAVISSTLTLMFSGRAAQTQAVEPRWVTQEEYETLQRYSRLEEVRTSLLRDYYQDLDDETLVLGAIRGMTRAVGDRYTFYYTPEEMKRADENNSGAYKGIGALLQNTTEGQIQVVRVYPNTPAEASGLSAGDWIVAVDGVAVSGEDGRSYNEAVNRIRGEDGMPVTLSLLRGDKSVEITIVRGEVHIDYASYRMLPGNIGYICISQFSGNASAVFHQAIEEFKAQGAAGLVIDLRDNPGGLLDQVVSIADSLLPAGIIVYVKEKDGNRQNFFSDDACYDVPLAVLVNEMSASASEILASSVQAFDRGTVIGLNTYGKGIVQTLHTFQSDGAGLQMTTSSYYDALDRCPQTVGVAPDIEVALVGDAVPLEPDPLTDNQLAAALEVLQKQIRD